MSLLLTPEEICKASGCTIANGIVYDDCEWRPDHREGCPIFQPANLSCQAQLDNVLNLFHLKEGHGHKFEFCEKHKRFDCIECFGLDKPDSEGWWWFVGKLFMNDGHRNAHYDFTKPMAIEIQLFKDELLSKNWERNLDLYEGKFTKALVPEGE